MTERYARRLAVLGDPIDHSLSPVLHGAAYRALELDWEFERIRVPAGGLARFLERLDASWRGLALTMPLKREVIGLVDEVHPLAARVEAVNTLVLRNGRRIGVNTDVHGVVEALRELGATAPETVRLVGAGATAASVLAALSRLDARRVEVVARSPERARSLEPLAAGLGLELELTALDAVRPRAAGLVVSTLPGDARLPDDAMRALTEGIEAPLFDVTYRPWPTPLAAAWERAGGRTASGLGMLLHQAVQQVRLFTGGELEEPLAREGEVIEAMRAAVRGESAS